MDFATDQKRFTGLLWAHVAASFAAMIAWLSEPNKLGGVLTEHLAGYRESDSFFAITVFSALGGLAVALSVLGLLLRWRWAKLYTLSLTGAILAFDLLMNRPIVNTSAALTFLKLDALVLGAILHSLYFTEFGRNWNKQGM